MANILPLFFYTWFLSFLLQLIAVPWLLRNFSRHLIDSGWAFGRLLTWVLVGLIIWFPAHLGIPVNNTYVVWLIIASLGVVSLIYFSHHKSEFIKILISNRWHILAEEILFIFGFFYLTIFRGIKAEILDLEKFMDIGFMASYLRAHTLPAPDMWLAGETINYYSFGHYLGSIMTRFWLQAVEYSYNLLLAFIMGLTMTQSYSVVVNLVSGSHKKINHAGLVFAGILGGILVAVAGNTHTIWYRLSNGSWQGYWYASATRFIDRTIHEFPSYSFVVSDIHGHVWGLPMVLLFIVLAYLWIKSIVVASSENSADKQASLPVRLRQACIPEKTINYFHFASLLGMLIGVMLMTNAWDMAIYGMFLGIIGLIVLAWYPRSFLRLAISALIVLIMLIATSSAWWLNFESISEGAAKATEHSPLWQLAVLWSGHGLMSLLAMVTSIGILIKTKAGQRSGQSHQFTLVAMVLTAWLLIILPELFYVKDIYTGHPRANTMFKLTYQGFIMMSLAGAWVFGQMTQLKQLKIYWRLLIAGLILAITFSLCLFPFFGYRDYFGFRKPTSLDGLEWLRKQHPNDYAAIQWFQQNVSGQPVILEAVGESYTTFDRVSAFTGLPTVLGWRVHEWLWRGGFDIPGQRTTEVQQMYEQPFSAQSQKYYDQYQVEYIVVGDKEDEAYQIHPEIKNLGEVVFEQATTYIVKRHSSASDKSR